MQFRTKEEVLAAADLIREEFAKTPEYHAEFDTCHRIYELWRGEHAGRACNELASHVRRVAHISNNAEHAIILLEKQARDLRETRALWKADQDRLTKAEDEAKELRVMLDAGQECRETALKLRIKELEAELEIARAAVPTN